LNWLLFLLGAELTVFLSLRQNLFKKTLPCGLDKIVLLKTVHENYLKGELSSLERLERELSIDPYRLYELLSELEKKEYIVIAEGLVLPTRDLGNLRLSEVLNFSQEVFEEANLSPILRNFFVRTTFNDIIHRNERGHAI